MANDKVLQLDDFVSYANQTTLSLHLDLDMNQKAEMRSIMDCFELQLGRAARAKEERKAERIHQAVMENLKLMRDLLSQKQYRTYLTTLNLSLESRGLRKYFA